MAKQWRRVLDCEAFIDCFESQTHSLPFGSSRDSRSSGPDLDRPCLVNGLGRCPGCLGLARPAAERVLVPCIGLLVGVGRKRNDLCSCGASRAKVATFEVDDTGSSRGGRLLVFLGGGARVLHLLGNFLAVVDQNRLEFVFRSLLSFGSGSGSDSGGRCGSKLGRGRLDTQHLTNRSSSPSGDNLWDKPVPPAAAIGFPKTAVGAAVNKERGGSSSAFAH